MISGGADYAPPADGAFVEPCAGGAATLGIAEGDMVKQAPSQGPRSGCLGPLRGLHDLRPLAREVRPCWEVLCDTAKGLRDKELEPVREPRGDRTGRRVARLRTRIDQAAPRVLIVPR